MRLVWLGVAGIGRFVEKTSVDVDGRVIALVGANEAGKTTLLRAWEQISLRDEGAIAGLVSQQVEVADDEEVIFARFALENDDRQMISHLYEGSRTRWLRIGIRKSGVLHFGFEPPLARDPAISKSLRRDLKRSLKNPVLREVDQDPEATFDFELLDSALAVVNDSSMRSEPFSRLKSALDGIDLEEAAQYVRDLPSALDLAIQSDEEDPPNRRAWEVLGEQVPVLKRFTERDRGLKSRYSIDDEMFPPASLLNLFALAEIDMDTLLSAFESENYGVAATMQEAANKVLAEQLQRWTQAELSVRLQVDVDSRVLGVFVQERSTDESGEFHPIDRRSDGMLWFVSLLAFLNREGDLDRPSIVMIDEAETHLHYDAQADLVASMTRQTLADKVIYTTHSAGCLPEDLSRVRVVERVGIDASRVENRYWRSGGGGGVSPLIMRMGASRFAYTRSRLAVIAEGASDFILWPTLLRDTVKADYLGFQIAPGLAEAGDEELKALELEAGQVAYLVDNDQPGERLVRRLFRLGVSQQRVVKVTYPMTTVEDAMDPDLLVEAVNENLQLSGHDKRFNVSTLRKNGRASQLSEWFGSHDLPPLKKVDLAQRALDIATREQRSLASKDRSSAIARLFDELQTALGMV